MSLMHYVTGKSKRSYRGQFSISLSKSRAAYIETIRNGWGTHHNYIIVLELFNHSRTHFTLPFVEIIFVYMLSETCTILRFLD